MKGCAEQKFLTFYYYYFFNRKQKETGGAERDIPAMTKALKAVGRTCFFLASMALQDIVSS